MSSGIRSSTPTTFGSILRHLPVPCGERKSVLGLPLIKNERLSTRQTHPRPRSSRSRPQWVPPSKCSRRDGHRVGRDQFLPVKTTSDLLVLRSRAYNVQTDGCLIKAADPTPVVDLDTTYYKIISDFDQRFPAGAPSLKEARSLDVNGDWTFEAGVRVIGEVTLEDRGAPQIIAAGATLIDPATGHN